MFIDYLTVMLINMVAAFVIHGLFIGRWMDTDPKKAVPGYLLTGFIALATGFQLIFTWPLPGAYNILFGDLTVLLGGFLFVAGLSLQFGWNLVTLGIYAFLAGAVAEVLAVRVLTLPMTSQPLASAAGYAVTGLTALLTLPVLLFPKQKWLRVLVMIAAFLSALAWALVVYPAYWTHMESFAKWPAGGVH